MKHCPMFSVVRKIHASTLTEEHPNTLKSVTRRLYLNTGHADLNHAVTRCATIVSSALYGLHVVFESEEAKKLDLYGSRDIDKEFYTKCIAETTKLGYGSSIIIPPNTIETLFEIKSTKDAIMVEISDELLFDGIIKSQVEFDRMFDLGTVWITRRKWDNRPDSSDSLFKLIITCQSKREEFPDDPRWDKYITEAWYVLINKMRNSILCAQSHHHTHKIQRVEQHIDAVPNKTSYKGIGLL